MPHKLDATIAIKDFVNENRKVVSSSLLAFPVSFWLDNAM